MKKYLSKIEYHRDLLKCQGERESEQAKGTWFQQDLHSQLKNENPSSNNLWYTICCCKIDAH